MYRTATRDVSRPDVDRQSRVCVLVEYSEAMQKVNCSAEVKRNRIECKVETINAWPVR